MHTHKTKSAFLLNSDTKSEIPEWQPTVLAILPIKHCSPSCAGVSPGWR